MKTARTHFCSEREIAEYVNACEEEYLAGVRSACRLAISGGGIITLAGPTCSGKTTTSRILDGEFEKSGRILHTVSIDDFYIDRDLLDERSRRLGIPLDYDSPSTIDFDCFGEVIEQIERRGRVTLPRFDFKTGRREGYYTIDCHGSDVFLFEGIQAVYPEFTEHLDTHKYTSLFISVEEPIMVGDTLFACRDLRLLRRIVRDCRERNTSAERTLSLWEGVCQNEDTHIYPNISCVDFAIDSTLGYEVSVIKPFVLPLLLEIPKDSEQYEKARALIAQLENVPETEEKYVPQNSVFREFIGG